MKNILINLWTIQKIHYSYQHLMVRVQIKLTKLLIVLKKQTEPKKFTTVSTTKTNDEEINKNDTELIEALNEILDKNNNELNSKDQIIEKEYENRYNSTSHSIYNKTNQNESSGYLSISQKILNNSLNKNKNERLLFSPKPCKTSVGYGFKKLSLKLNNQTENKKAYENKQYENQVSNTNEIINNNDNNDNNENNEKNYKNKNKEEIKIKNKNNKKDIRKSITNMIFSNNNKNKLNIKII